MKNTMNAIKLTQPCKTDELKVSKVEIPILKPGYALVKVKALGVNESEVTSRKGESSADFSFPRILGIEGVGIVEAVNSGSKFKPGEKVATMMGGLGRSIDGSYAEYMLVKEKNLIPLDTDLDWATIGALPEMTQTAYGSLTEGLNLKPKETVLIRGGSSTVGLMAIVIAKELGAQVIATTRKEEKLAKLKQYGADFAVLDNDDFSSEINRIKPDGIDKVLELVGLSTLFVDMRFLKLGGKACFTGALSGSWTMDNFSPFMIPSGRFLTSYAGEAQDLPEDIFNKILKLIKENKIEVPIAKVYHGLDKVGQAQENLESGTYVGKHVVVL